MRDPNTPLDLNSYAAKLERNWGEPPMRSAPGEDLLAAFGEAPSYTALDRFYRARLRWCGGGTMIHYGPSSTHPFSEAAHCLRRGIREPFTDWALDIALREPWENIAFALWLVIACRQVQPEFNVAEFRSTLEALRRKVAMAAVIGADQDWHSFIATMQRLATQIDAPDLHALVTAAQPLVPWQSLIPLPRSVADADPGASCGFTRANIDAEAQGTAKRSVPPLFSGRFESDSATYWFWRCLPKDANWLSNCQRESNNPHP